MEDDDSVAAVVGQMLAELGFVVTRVASAAAARRAVAHGREIDLVLSDVLMPGGMNGVELARALRGRHPDLPVVLTIAHAGTAKRDAEPAGIVLLPEPYRLDELAAVTADALGR